MGGRDAQALGRSQGGFSAKVHITPDVLGKSFAFYPYRRPVEVHGQEIGQVGLGGHGCILSQNGVKWKAPGHIRRAIAYGFCGVRYNSGQRRLAWSEVEAEAEETPP